MRKLLNSELNRPDIDTFKNADKHPIIVVLDNVRSLNNVGSVFRTSDAFNVQSIYLCGITATPPNKEIHKTALGAENSVEWKYFETTELALQQLKSEGYTIASIEQAENSVLLNKLNIDAIKKLAVVFGNEVEGVAQNIVSSSDMVIEIPQWGTKHSLNISVSVAVVLWELVRG